MSDRTGEELIGTAEVAARWKLSAQTVRRMCARKQIQGARKIGRDWLIPSPPVRLTTPRRRLQPQDVDNIMALPQPGESRNAERDLEILRSAGIDGEDRASIARRYRISVARVGQIIVKYMDMLEDMETNHGSG